MSTDKTLAAALDVPAAVPDNSAAFPIRDQTKLAWQDLTDSVRKWRIWFMLAYQDIKIRYRRSVLGPFWITLSMAITAYSMGFLYSHIFHTDMQNYFPFLVGGMLAWGLISGTVSDLVETFTIAEHMIKQIKLPYSLYISRVAARNIIIFLHNIPIIFPIILIFHQTAKVNLNTLILIPGLILFYINALNYGLILAMLGARFRDIIQIVKSLIQVVFFVTPVLWNPNILPLNKQFIAEFNPFYAFIEFLRCPLIGTAPMKSSWIMITIVTLIGFAFSFNMFKRYRARIVYWL